MDDATIFAPATAPGRAGIAVIRVSGPRARHSVVRLGAVLPPPRQAMRVQFCDGANAIDDGLLLWFPAPRSFTGEDVAEFHVHGSRAVIAKILEVLGRDEGMRLAEPGEFARRAFDHGKLDLTAVEGLADLIAAETEAQRRQALRQAEGALGRLYDDWRRRLVGVMARMEAAIDFPEEDLPPSLLRDAKEDVRALMVDLGTHLAAGMVGERLRAGFSVAILGPPNVGKSSLLNALAKREAAIVSARAGTTRDIVEVHLDLAGYPVLLADTAGLRDSGDEIEIEGVRRALARAACADLRLVVLDATDPGAWTAALAAIPAPSRLVVVNKIDAAPEAACPADALAISVRTGAGLGMLAESLAKAAAIALESGGALVPTRARHRALLQATSRALARSLEARLPELAAEDLRLAARSLGQLTGRVDVEDVLDALFREFCIGK